MKKFNDSRIYLVSSIVALAVGLVLGVVSFYSILVVEPKIAQLLSSGADIDKNYSKAYLILRDPQVFAGYSNFDAEGISVKNSLKFFDRKIYYGETIDLTDRAYLEILLERRKKGAILGRNTMAFFVLISLISIGLFFHERKTAQSKL